MNFEKIHLVFFDGECGVCDQAVRYLITIDKEKKFVFAPLNGETALNYLKGLPDALKNSDSLILIENYLSWNRHASIGSTAILRICWLLGGWWAIPGVLYFLPAFLFNWIYRLFARYRHRFFQQECFVPSKEEKDRFLP